MSANAANLEAQVNTLDASRLPATGTWSARSAQVPGGVSVQGGSKITLTNVTGVKVEVGRDGTPIGELGGRDLMTLTLDPTAPHLVTFKPKPNGQAEGFFAVHDSRFDWQLEQADAEHQTGFIGARTLALVNHPRSGFTVQLIAGGGSKVRVAPGEARIAGLNAEEARSVVIRRFGEATGGTKAQGTICVSGDGAE